MSRSVCLSEPLSELLYGRTSYSVDPVYRSNRIIESPAVTGMSAKLPVWFDKCLAFKEISVSISGNFQGLRLKSRRNQIRAHIVKKELLKNIVSSFKQIFCMNKVLVRVNHRDLPYVI